jgi:hypothetical protein
MRANRPFWPIHRAHVPDRQRRQNEPIHHQSVALIDKRQSDAQQQRASPQHVSAQPQRIVHAHGFFSCWIRRHAAMPPLMSKSISMPSRLENAGNSRQKQARAIQTVARGIPTTITDSGLPFKAKRLL